MHTYYCPDSNDQQAMLTGDEFHHCAHVMRQKPGDLVRLVNGAGIYFQGTIREMQRSEALVSVERTWHEPAASYAIHLAIAPTKQINRLEWCLEKCTEIGIASITPIITTHSERRSLNLGRLQKILVSAMKQSGRAWLPKLYEPRPLATALREDRPGQQRLIAHLREDSVSLETNYLPGSSVFIIIGPEGDFSTDEISQAREFGFTPVSLGNSRLRTETAGVMACQTIHVINRMKC